MRASRLSREDGNLMVSTTVTNADARNRAFRTFVQGLLIDVGTAVTAALAASLTDVQWTKAFWVTLGFMVGKTALQAAVSYVARKVLPPKVV